MVHCMDMRQQDWEVIIEGVGLESACQKWEARPKAARPIDVEWRNKTAQKPTRKASTIDGAAIGAAIASEEDMDDSSNSDEDTEDEFSQFPDSQIETFEAAATESEEDAKAWDETVDAEEGQNSSAHVSVGSRSRNNHENGNVRRGEQNVEQGATQESTVTKRARTSEGRHCQRNRKKARDAATSGCANPNQRALKMVVGKSTTSKNYNSSVPWEHRCILGQTRRSVDNEYQ